MTDPSSDLLVIGGGVMGLFTAYRAARAGRSVVVLERGRVGDPLTASYGRTRSFRNDYLDPVYARLAHEAFRLWQEFEEETGARVLVRCGCLNIAKRSDHARPRGDLRASAATRRSAASASRRSRSTPPPCATASPTSTPTSRISTWTPASSTCRPCGTRSRPRCASAACASTRAWKRPRSRATGEEHRVDTGAGGFAARALVVTAGHGTNDVLARLAGCTLQVPITKDRPSDAKYLAPPADVRRSLHGGRDAGDRLPGRRHLLPSHRRGRRRRGEDRLLQPARPAAQRDADRRHRQLRRAVPAGSARRGDARRGGRRPVRLRPRGRRRVRARARAGRGRRVRRRGLARHGLQVRALGRARARRAGAGGAHAVRPGALLAGPLRPHGRRADEPPVRPHASSSASPTAWSSAPRAMCSSSSGAATSRPARTSRR